MATTNASGLNVVMRLADAEDLPQLEPVRQAAFVPIFASFRSILGDEIYELAQAAEDRMQDELLASTLAPESDWQIYTAETDCTIVGFIAIQLNQDTQVGPKVLARRVISRRPARLQNRA